jgi:hypothetical protein
MIKAEVSGKTRAMSGEWVVQITWQAVEIASETKRPWIPGDR